MSVFMIQAERGYFRWHGRGEGPRRAADIAWYIARHGGNFAGPFCFDCSCGNCGDVVISVTGSPAEGDSLSVGQDRHSITWPLTRLRGTTHLR